MAQHPHGALQMGFQAEAADPPAGCCSEGKPCSAGSSYPASTSGAALLLQQRAEGDATRHLLVPRAGLGGSLTSKLTQE